MSDIYKNYPKGLHVWKGMNMGRSEKLRGEGSLYKTRWANVQTLASTPSGMRRIKRSNRT